MKVALFSLVFALGCIAVVFGQDTTKNPPPTPSPWFQCPGEGYFPNPYDCSKYFVCQRRPNDDTLVAWGQHCPGGLWYNPAKGLCDFKSNVDCQAQSTPSP
ncbi:peritrophin-1-like [Ischnura elegans]|uniref:peritrophin-1-like n=1 Tax=Ischnura elegans TaxID=197161 RepID=UPI001ED8ACF2|nr:peritrophin-1-like [Ischnura elegans]